MSNSNSPPESAEQRERDQELITSFFEKKVPSVLSETVAQSILTQSDCHVFASEYLQCDDINPVPSQGSFSYTVFSSKCQKVVQFRLKRLNEEILSIAHEIYGDLVPQSTFIDGFTLPVYISPLAQGQLQSQQPYPDTQLHLKRQINTVRDLARFIAKGASTPISKAVEAYAPDSWTLTAKSTLNAIISSQTLAELEPRFAWKAKSLLSRVHLLEKLPPALCHPDFFEINIMVEPITGALTAVLDWDGAQLEAFGMMIYGVYDSFFGYISGHSADATYSWFGPIPDSDDPRSAKDILETEFWDIFWESVPSGFGRAEYEEAIKVAVEVGLVQRNLPRSLVEGAADRREQLDKCVRIMRGVWLGL